MKLEYLRAEIERMRIQIRRQRSDIQKLQRAGISTLSADALLERMQDKVDAMCAERDRQIGEAKAKYAGTNKVIRGPQMRIGR
ncbi:hypothetical protein [Afipia clevelandensis]|uniref:Uncharacterized protein n=1 Tax=Afipia clevelandensis ATCC 49720 TaxID=883079 RepID=K8PNJ5_9BRAD|nr:hypothetical protein [Afipia clevelandensis]EKS39933.1 hypothetical protein HMPREF9696_00945 [Afipia clevelandensis ATCC 49720]